MPTSENDAQAAERIYGQLISPIERRMMQTVHRIVRDPDLADDAFQEALARVWKNLAKAHRHPNPRGYILRICANAAYDAARKQAQAVHLRVFEQQDFIDIARAIGCREATARSHVSKGMARLREILGEATRHNSKERRT